MGPTTRAAAEAPAATANATADPLSQRMEARLAAGALDGEALGRQSLVDMLLLAECDVLLGKFSSNLFRAAVEYRAGLLAQLPIFVSLDAAWCFLYKGSIVRGAHAGERYDC